jgi:alpha-tubulin suppressor-like RCC1 family protein
MATILPKYKILKQLDPEFCHNIKLVCVYGDGETALILTKDDNVYTITPKNIDCKDHHEEQKSEKLTKIEELCNKKVTTFAYGSYHTLALTQNGELFAWGGNSLGQLGDVLTTGSSKPKQITNIESKSKIIDMACGMAHNLALTEDGEVFAWGCNDYGQVGSDSYKGLPIKVDIKDKVTAISCGFNHSMVLTKSGQVYSWGHNRFGQLGIDNNKDQNKPQLIDIGKKVIIQKICCGNDHNLLLSKDREVYTFGKNSCGQLGIGNKENKNEPVKIESSVKFNDIAASIFNNISVAVSDLSCYVWGQCGDIRITVPSETTVKSVHEIFAKYAAKKFTHKPINF